MVNDSKLPISYQESVATCVALVNDRNSQAIATTIDVTLLDKPFDDIVSRAVEYRKKYKRPIGKEHIDDVFGHILDDTHHKSHQQYLRIIQGMLRQADGINTQYIADHVSEFHQMRLMRGTIAEAAERYQKGGEGTLSELEDILRKSLKIKRKFTESVDFSMADGSALDFLDKADNDYCKLGIPELDNYGVHPTRKELLGFLAARNHGKSQWLGHCGKMGLLKGWKVLHYTLENSADMTAMRYWQSLFSGVRREDDYRVTLFDVNDDDSVSLRSAVLKPKFVIQNKEATYKFLNKELNDEYGLKQKLANLRICQFPTGKLSFSGMEKHLDELAVVHNFYPDMILVDSPQLMRLSRQGNMQDHTALDELVINLRGLMIERNAAGVITHQGNRQGETTGLMEGQHGSGSIGILAIVDNYITYSRTKAEEEHGIARLLTAKVRNDEARHIILITQHYASGQFVISSHRMTKQLRDAAKTYIGDQNGDEDEDDYKSDTNSHMHKERVRTGKNK